MYGYRKNAHDWCECSSDQHNNSSSHLTQEIEKYRDMYFQEHRALALLKTQSEQSAVEFSKKMTDAMVLIALRTTFAIFFFGLLKLGESLTVYEPISRSCMKVP